MDITKAAVIDSWQGNITSEKVQLMKQDITDSLKYENEKIRWNLSQIIFSNLHHPAIDIIELYIIWMVELIHTMANCISS